MWLTVYSTCVEYFGKWEYSYGDSVKLYWFIQQNVPSWFNFQGSIVTFPQILASVHIIKRGWWIKLVPQKPKAHLAKVVNQHVGIHSKFMLLWVWRKTKNFCTEVTSVQISEPGNTKNLLFLSPSSLSSKCPFSKNFVCISCIPYPSCMSSDL